MSGVLDFYAPFVAARIITGDGQVYPLWMQEEATLPNELSSLAFLESVEVQMAINGPPNITLTLTPPYRDGRKLLESNLIEYGVSTIEVQFGYTSGVASGEAILSPVYSARMGKPEINIGEDYSITLTGQGLGTDSIMWSVAGGTYEGKRIDIIKQLMESGPAEVDGMPQVYSATSPLTGRRIVVDDSAVLEQRGLDPAGWEVPSAEVGDFILGKFAYYFVKEAEKQANRNLGSSTYLTQAHDLMYTDQISITGAFISPWSLVQHLVMEARCRMMLIGNLLKIFPVEGWLSSTPVRRLRFYDYPPDALEVTYNAGGDLPLLSVSSDIMQKLTPKEAVYMTDVDSETREPVADVYGDSVLRPPRSRTDGIIEQPKTVDNPEISSTGSGANRVTGNPKDKLAVANAIAMYDDISMTHLGISMEVTTLMDPGLLPGMTVEVVGVSGRHDGNYAVREATYTVGTGGAEMSMNLLSNVVVNAVQDPDLAPQGYENDQEADNAGSQPKTSAKNGE